MSDELGVLVERLARLEDEVQSLRTLAARTYERSEGWRDRLEQIRRSPDYAAAFSGSPLITIRIGTYRGAEALCARALASARRQSYTSWEAAVVGDGCDDDTEERIAALGDSRIRFYNRPCNGPYPEDPALRWLVAGTYAFNEAAEWARGSWIAPIDQDDEWDDDHLAVLLHAAQCGRAELVYGRMRAVIDGTGEETWFGEWPPQQGDFGFQAALYHAGLKGFRYDMAAALVGEPGDWNLARRMWDAGVRFHFLPRLVGTYHVAPDAQSVVWWRERVSQRGPLPAMEPPALPAPVSADIHRLLDQVLVDFGGGCSEHKANVLAQLVIEGKLRRAVDIGVYRGRSLLPLAVAFKWLGSGEAIGIDPYSTDDAVQADDHSFGRALTDWAQAQDWESLYRDVVDLLRQEGLDTSARIVRTTSNEAARSFAPASLDLVHIDGNHDANHVQNDFELYRGLVRPAGFIVLDGVSWASVQPVYQRLRLSARLVVEAYTERDDFAVFQVP